MKNLFLIVFVSLLSSILSIAGYKYFEEPKVIIRESAPVRYTNYTDPNEESFIGKGPRTFLSATPTNFTSAAEAVTPAVVNIKSKWRV